MSEKARSAQQKRANAKFFPIDTATLSNVLVALSLFWQIISMLSNTGVSTLLPRSADLNETDRGDHHLPVETE
jgi:hypothetical protein